MPMPNLGSVLMKRVACKYFWQQECILVFFVVFACRRLIFMQYVIILFVCDLISLDIIFSYSHQLGHRPQADYIVFGIHS